MAVHLRLVGREVCVAETGDRAEVDAPISKRGRQLEASFVLKAIDVGEAGRGVAAANFQRTDETRAKRRARTRLAERGATLAAADERNRIARDIHDTIAQSLAAVTMQLESADALLEAPNPSRAGETVRRALELTRATLEEARHSVVAIRTTPLAGRGLLGALRALPDEIAAATGSRVSITIARLGDETLPTAVEIGAYHIVREALTNVARHAAATSADVRLEERDGILRLRVSDDGTGFDVARRSAERFGLVGMRERAHLLGGELRIDSAPGRGTTLEVDLPIERRTVEGAVAAAADGVRS